MTRRNRWFLLLAGTMTAALVAAAACGGGKSNSDKTATAGPGGSASTSSGEIPGDAASDSEQILRTHAASEPNTLDPQAASYDYEITVVKQLYVTLLDQDPETSKLAPLAAAEVPTTENGGISADGLTYTIKLKPGLKWSDGSALTSEDFVYGIVRGYNLNVSGNGYGGFITQIKNAGAALDLDPSSATYTADVAAALKDSVVAVDPTTLKIVLSAPSVSFPYNLFLPITAAVSKANVEALGDNFGQALSAAQMVTSGAFTVAEWAPKDHITIQRNDNFTGVGHKAFLKQVNYRFISDANQAYNAYQADQLDEMSQVPAALYPGVKESQANEIHQEPEFGVRSITIDATLEPWNNKDFVIGMSQATDREAIGRDVYFGLREPWAAACAAAVAHCDPSLFSDLEFDLTKAKASIAKAYPNGNIPTVTLEIPDDPTTNALATTLQSQWEKVGVTTTIVTTDQKTLRADFKAHKSGTQITGWSMDFADPTDLYSIKTTAQIGANNQGFYSRPPYDQMVAQQDATFDDAARADILKQIQQFLAADPPDIYFAAQLRTDLYKPYVKGIASSPFDYYQVGDQRLAEVYIAKH